MQVITTALQSQFLIGQLCFGLNNLERGHAPGVNQLAVDGNQLAGPLPSIIGDV